MRCDDAGAGEARSRPSRARRRHINGLLASFAEDVASFERLAAQASSSSATAASELARVGPSPSDDGEAQAVGSREGDAARGGVGGECMQDVGGDAGLAAEAPLRDAQRWPPRSPSFPRTPEFAFPLDEAAADAGAAQRADGVADGEAAIAEAAAAPAAAVSDEEALLASGLIEALLEDRAVLRANLRDTRAALDCAARQAASFRVARDRLARQCSGVDSIRKMLAEQREAQAQLRREIAKHTADRDELLELLHAVLDARGDTQLEALIDGLIAANDKLWMMVSASQLASQIAAPSSHEALHQPFRRQRPSFEGRSNRSSASSSSVMSPTGKGSACAHEGSPGLSMAPHHAFLSDSPPPLPFDGTSGGERLGAVADCGGAEASAQAFVVDEEELLAKEELLLVQGALRDCHLGTPTAEDAVREDAGEISAAAGDAPGVNAGFDARTSAPEAAAGEEEAAGPGDGAAAASEAPSEEPLGAAKAARPGHGDAGEPSADATGNGDRRPEERRLEDRRGAGEDPCGPSAPRRGL